MENGNVKEGEDTQKKNNPYCCHTEERLCQNSEVRAQTLTTYMDSGASRK